MHYSKIAFFLIVGTIGFAVLGAVGLVVLAFRWLAP